MAANQDVKNVLQQVGRLENFLNREKFQPATASYRTAVLLPLLSKALTVGRAVCALVQAGFCAEAFATTRTVIEIFFTVRYITNKETEKRAERYVKYHAKVSTEWMKSIRQYLPDMVEKLRPLDAQIMKNAEVFDSRARWAGPGVTAKTMAHEEDSFEYKEDGKGINTAFAYDTSYFATSQYVHATVEALGAHYSEPGKIFRVRMHASEELFLGQKALFIAGVHITKSFVCALRCMNVAQPIAMKNLLTTVTKIARKDVARRKSKGN